jgi:hypothetical protein
MPAQETRVDTAGGQAPARQARGPTRSRPATPKTKTTRATIAATSTPAQSRTTRPALTPERPAPERTTGSCSPITRKTAFSRTNAIVRQVIDSVTRAEAVCTFGETWASARPVTTVASTPEACSASAGRKAR